MEKVAHSLFGLPPSVSLNTADHFDGLPSVSAWNHRNFLYAAKLQKILIPAAVFSKKITI